MTTVTGTMTAPGGGQPYAAAVVVTLVALDGAPVIGFTSTSELVGQTTVTVNVDGTWSLVLPPTAQVTSPRGNTLYRVDEMSANGRARYHISVPASGTHWVGDLHVTLPGTATEQLVGYLPLTGGTLTGALVLNDDSPAASQQYVTDHAGGGGGGGGTPSTTVVAETSYGQSSAAGTASAYSRGDHTHGTPALPTPGAIGAATAGHAHSGVYDPVGTASGAVSTHASAPDPHPQYLLAVEGDAAYASIADARIIGAVQQSLVTAKGDLLVATLSGVVSRLAAGSDGQILTADAAQTTGLKWAAPAGGSAGGPVYPLSAYGLLACSGDPESFMLGSSSSNNTIFGSRVKIAAGVTITNLWAAVRTGGTYSASSNPNRLGIYDDTGAQLGVTADDSTLWTAAGWRGGPLVGGPIAAQGADRMVYILIIFGGMVGTVMPYPSSANDANTGWFCRGVSGAGPRRAFYAGAGGGGLPSSFSPSSYGTETTYLSLVGVS